MKTCDTLEKQPGHQDVHVTSAPKEEKSKSGIIVEDQGDIGVMKNENHENDVGIKSQKVCDDAVSSGFGNESDNLSKDSPEDSLVLRRKNSNILVMIVLTLIF